MEEARGRQSVKGVTLPRHFERILRLMLVCMRFAACYRKALAQEVLQDMDEAFLTLKQARRWKECAILCSAPYQWRA